MASFVSLLIALNSSTLNFGSLDRLNYAKETVGQLMANLGGYCLFIGADTRLPYDNAMGDILQHPELQTFPRIVLNRQFVERFWGGRRPSLLLADDEGRYTTSYKPLYQLFEDIGVTTRVLMILDTKSEKSYWSTVKMLGLGSMFNMALISTTEKRVLYFKVNHLKLRDLSYPPKVDELYKHQFGIMDNDTVTVTMRNMALGIYGNWTSPAGPAVRWIQETVEFLKGKFLCFKHLCRIYSASRKTCYETFLKQNQVVISLDGMPLEDNNRHKAWSFLDLSIPHSMTPLVPQPVSLERPQLYGDVFEFKVFIFVSLLISSVELFVVCRSRLAMLDLTLYALHGHRPDGSLNYKPWQVASMFGLIIIVSVLTTAFGANLYSLTFKRPSNPLIQTLDDLLLTDIKLKADLIQYPELQQDPRFRSRISHHDIRGFILDGQHAYILDTEMADLLLALQINYDHQRNRVRYRRLETFNVDVQFRHVEDRYLFLGQFVQTERIFFESGIWNHWNEEHRWRVNGMMKPERKELVEEGHLVEESLSLDDLMTAWLLLGIGLIVAYGIFLVEGFLYIFL